MKKTLLALIVAVAVILFSAAMAESDAPVWEFDADDGRITAYNGSGGEVVVPDSVDGVTVTEIDINVFNGRNDITSVIFPDTVEVLCGSVCAWMDNLTSIRLPESLLVMESGCLQGPDALKEVTDAGAIADALKSKSLKLVSEEIGSEVLP